QDGKGQVVILSHGFWQRRYGGDKNIINRSITLNDTSYTVVGVMPPGIYPVSPTPTGQITFDEPRQTFWIPMAFSPQFASWRSAHVLGVLARLKPGITIQQATADMDALGARL